MKQLIQERLHQALQSSQHGATVKQSRLWLRAVLWSLIGASGFSIAWLALAQTEEIALVQGKLEPSAGVSEIRIPVAGVTEAVLVKEGQSVKKGQVLLRLDTDLSSKRKRGLDLAVGLKQQQLQEKRRERESFLLQNAQQTEVLAKNLLLQQQILSRLEKLERQGASAELQTLQQRNKVDEVQGQLSNTTAERSKQAAVYAQQIQALEGERTELSSRLKEQQVTLRYQEVKAPVDGVVFDLKPTGKGYVLGERSSVVLKLVPFARLQADVEIPSRDIGFIRSGQRADISIDSFPAADFGVLEGRVSRIGSDALPPDPQQNKAEFRYPATIQLNRQHLTLKDGRKLGLQSGMSLTAHIKLRKTSYLQLLLGSFRDKGDALRTL